MNPLYKFKEEQKEIAKQLRVLKRAARTSRSFWDRQIYDYEPVTQWGVEYLKRHYRHRHIAYCLVRGTPLEKIEKSCHTSPDEKKYRKWVDLLKSDLKEYYDSRIKVYEKRLQLAETA